MEFFYKKFFINKNTLIPRFETECLVREWIKIIKNYNIKTLIDVWTWSWVIPVSIWLNSKLDNIFAIDISKNALKMAQLNAKNYDISINFLHSNLLKDFLKNNYKINGNILITANLPYIKENDWENMSEDTIFEPKRALFWWKKTGFELYQTFFRQIIKLKNIYNNKFYILCEIGYNQKELATQFLTKLKLSHEFIKDLREIDRIIKIEV